MNNKLDNLTYSLNEYLKGLEDKINKLEEKVDNCIFVDRVNVETIKEDIIKIEDKPKKKYNRKRKKRYQKD